MSAEPPREAEDAAEGGGPAGHGAPAERERAERGYRDIFENAAEGVFQTTPSGRLLTANPALSRMLGYSSPEELIAATHDVGAQFYADPGLRAAFIERVETRDEVRGFEHRLRRRDGGTIWVSENARAVRDASGRVLYYEGSLEDIGARKTAEEAQQRHGEYLAALQETTLAVLSRLEPAGLLEMVLAQAGKLLGAGHGAVYLPGGGGLELKATIGTVGAMAAGEAAPVSALAEEAGTSRQPQVLRRVADGESGWLSLLAAVPLECGLPRCGAIVIGYAAGAERSFESAEFELLGGLARLASIGLDNARLHAGERNSRALAERLQASAQAVNESLDLDVVLPAIMDELRKVIDYDSGTIQLLEGDAMRVIAMRGLPPEEMGRVRPLAEYEYNRRLATDRAPIVQPVLDTEVLWRVEPHVARIESNIGVPLIVRDRIIGALTVDSHQPGRYSDADAETVMAFARQAAIAIENARLYGAERAAREQAERLRAATQALTTTMDLKQVLGLILRELRRVVPYDSASIQELREGSALEITGGDGFPNLGDLLGVRFDLERGDNPNREVIGTRAPVIVDDAPGVYSDFRALPHVQAGVRSWLGVPLLFGDRLIGMLALDKREPEFYTSEHVGVAVSFAAQAAIAIENARLYTSAQQEVAERARAEEALRESEARYRAVSELTSDWAYALRLEEDGRVLVEWVTGAFQRMTGYARPELDASSGLPGIVHADDQELVRRRWEGLLAGRTETSEFRIVTKGGDVRRLRIHGHPVLDPAQGRVVRVYGAAQDVTERRREEEEQARLRGALEESAHEWTRTFDAVQSPVLIMDARGRVTRLNRAAQAAIGKPFNEIIGRPVAEIDPRQPWLRVAALADEVTRRRVAAGGDAEDALGRSWDVAATLVPAADLDAERVIVVCREITAMVKLQESLRRSETMSAMGALVAGVAHEVRNPLFAITATLDAFEARFGANEEHARYIGVLRGELDRMGELMRELLAYGRPPSLQFGDGSIESVIEQAAHACAALLRRSRVTVASTIPSGLPLVPMDRGRMLQVFQNLLENAVQHSAAGGAIVLEAAVVGEGGSAWMQCVVKDEGTGFREEDLPRIFDPFFTRRRGGTGLGLSIVQRIVEEHGGTVSAGNRPEGGAEVAVRLPLKR